MYFPWKNFRLRSHCNCILAGPENLLYWLKLGAGTSSLLNFYLVKSNLNILLNFRRSVWCIVHVHVFFFFCTSTTKHFFFSLFLDQSTQFVRNPHTSSLSEWSAVLLVQFIQKLLESSKWGGGHLFMIRDPKIIVLTTWNYKKISAHQKKTVCKERKFVHFSKDEWYFIVINHGAKILKQLSLHLRFNPFYIFQWGKKEEKEALICDSVIMLLPIAPVHITFSEDCLKNKLSAV